MRASAKIGSLFAAAGAILLLMLVAACGTETEIVEVEKEVIVKEEVVKEVPVEVVVEREVVREVPVETVMVKEVPVEKIVKEIVEVEKEVVKEVPVEVVVEKEVVMVKEVPVEVVVEKEVVMVKEVPVEVVVETEVIKEVVKEVPVTAVVYEVPVYPGKVTLMTGNWANERWDPRDGGKWGMTYVRQLHGYLIEGNQSNQLIPGIATDWELGSDLRTYSYTLRDGVKFHNGDELTMDDILFTLDHMFSADAQGKSLNSQVIAHGKLVENIEVTGPNTFSMTLTDSKADWPFYQSRIFPDHPGGAILPKNAFDTLGDEGWEKAPVGSGPFRLVRHKPSELIRMERFDDYYYQPKNGLAEDRRTKFQTLEIFLVPEEATRVAALVGGQADIVEASLASVDQITGGGGHIVWSRESWYHMALQHYCWEPDRICNNKKVRQAFQYAIDQDLIRDTLYGGGGMFETDGWLHVTPSVLGWSADIRPYPYNPAKAKALLAEAGYPGGAGFPDDLKVITYEAPEWPLLPEMSRLVADMLEETLNIPVEYIVGEYGDIVARIEAGEVGNHIFLRVNDNRWDGGSIAVCCYMEPFAWHTRGSDPNIHAAGMKAVAELDPAKRHAAYNEFYKVIHDEQYAFGLGYLNLPYGVSARVVDWQPWPVNSYPNALWTIIVDD